MGQITIELNKDIDRKRPNNSYTIPKGTTFIVNEEEFNKAKQKDKYLGSLYYSGYNHAIHSNYLDKVTTPLEFATQEEYVILECIYSSSEIELGSLHKVRKTTWETEDKEYLYLTENVKKTGYYHKKKFKLHQPNQILNPVTGKPRKPETIEVEVLEDSIAKTDDGTTHYRIGKDNIIEVNKEEWENKALQKVTIKTDRPEYELKEWKSNLRYSQSIKNLLLEPIKPTQAFKSEDLLEDKQITIKCIDNTGYTGRLTLGKTYQIYQSEWDKHHEFIIPKHNSKEGVYQMLKSRFEIVSDEMKAKEPIYNKVKIATLTEFKTYGGNIPFNFKFTVDYKDWHDSSNRIIVRWNGKKLAFDKSCFRLVHRFHEEAGTFPSITSDTGTGKSDSILSFITSAEPRTPQWWGFDKSGELTYTDDKGNPISKEYVGRDIANSDSVTIHSALNLEPKLPKDWADAVKDGYTQQEYYNMIMNTPSHNESSLRTKPWQDQVAEMVQYYNTPITAENYETVRYPFGKATHEALEKRLADIKHGKQLVWDEVGIPPHRGIGIKEQIEHASNTSILWQDFPQQMVLQKARRSGGFNSSLMIKHLWESISKPKSLLKNITRSKKPKKKKQHIVESMSNIKL